MTIMQTIFWLLALLVNVLVLIFWLLDWNSIFLIFSLGFTLLGIYDLKFSPHTLNRLYPIAAYIRYALEYIRPRRVYGAGRG